MIRSTAMRRAAHLALLVALAGCSQLRQGTPPEDAAVDAAVDVVDAPRACVWVDESGSLRDGAMLDFGGTPTSGFAGAGTPDDPTALVFDGRDDRVDPMGDPMHFPRELTVTTWVRLRTNSGRQTVFSNRSTIDAMEGYSGYVLYVEDGTWRSIYFTNYYPRTIDWEYHGTVRARVGAWTHLALTYSLDEGFTRFYVDGALVTERRATRPIDYNDAARPHVGGETAGDSLQGSVGLVRVWSRGLSRDEVVDEFRTTAPRFGVTPDAEGATVRAADALRYESACPR